jgi:hypothetical protein
VPPDLPSSAPSNPLRLIIPLIIVLNVLIIGGIALSGRFRRRL